MAFDRLEKDVGGGRHVDQPRTCRRFRSCHLPLNSLRRLNLDGVVVEVPLAVGVLGHHPDLILSRKVRLFRRKFLDFKAVSVEFVLDDVGLDVLVVGASVAPLLLGGVLSLFLWFEEVLLRQGCPELVVEA